MPKDDPSVAADDCVDCYAAVGSDPEMKRIPVRFVQFCVLWAFALVVLGCGGATYEIVAASSYLPTSAQMELANLNAGEDLNPAVLKAHAVD